MGYKKVSHSYHEHEMHDKKSHTTHEGNEDHDHIDHGHMGHMEHIGNLKQKFWISLIITIPILLLSTFMGIELPFQFSFPGSNWIVLILSNIFFIYGGTPFLSIRCNTNY
jgi:Cu2+-exporting ATPase